MHIPLLNIVSALTIGLIIALMAAVKNVRLKALVYSLPLPITIALIATKGTVTSASLSGLALLCGFLWLTYLLYVKLQWHIVAADIVSAVAYIFIGYLAVKTIHLQFWVAGLLYCGGWLTFVISVRNKPCPKLQQSDVPSYAKGGLTSILAFILFTLKNSLSGVVVTFPYSGVFAVVEARDYLFTLARMFCINSIATLGLFIMMYSLQSHVAIAFRFLLSWMVYLVLFKLVRSTKFSGERV